MKDRGNERIEFLNRDESAKNSLIDLSFSGAAMNCPTEWKTDSRLSVKIRDLLLNAQVIYCQERGRGYRVGVHFISVTPDVQIALKLMVDEFSRGVPISFEIVEPDEETEV